MKKFFSEFKKFITRGSVIDLAVGVIIGSSFTAIVSALSDNILKPIINWLLAVIMGASSVSEVYTFLKFVPSETDASIPDLSASIYIDWGAFINAIINFLIVAFILFLIVKAINALNENYNKISNDLKKITKQDKKELKKLGIKIYDVKSVQKYLEEKQKAIDETVVKEEEKPTVESLLTDIKEILKQQTVNNSVSDVEDKEK